MGRLSRYACRTKRVFVLRLLSRAASAGLILASQLIGAAAPTFAIQLLTTQEQLVMIERTGLIAQSVADSSLGQARRLGERLLRD